MNDRLEIRASRFQAKLQIILSLLFAIVLLVLGWLEFGPKAIKEAKATGETIVGFLIVQIGLGALFLYSVRSLLHYFQLWRQLPVIFILEKMGITDRTGTYRQWTEFEYSRMHAGTVYLGLPKAYRTKELVIEPDEIGYATADKVLAFIRKYAPPELWEDL